MTFVVTAWSESAGELRELHTWVIRERAIRGRARIVEVETEGDRLGPLADSLQVTLESHEALAALAGMVVRWLDTRPEEVTVRLTRGEREIAVSAREVRSLPSEGVRELTARLTGVLDGDGRRSL
ncbi:hypothetical protein ABGB17_35275 [Sphaerisporangium sp. B11E5]|uniref:effector-associated constant component EACC1 n=1 Tax=Sphaerisporangium sp. B11E5 TaxID=3153563 RepID=UPI00325EAD62